ncbi:TPA: hypothetical protein DEP58_03870 [Patescibacteria group bacterium]|nr:MAG: hypothetical protein UU98_C0009G0030 [Parcubacteria group bacterium GW2011_GWD2_42_14]HCC05411.1 hypothetical protein [Patescibacteria group bacterium]
MTQDEAFKVLMMGKNVFLTGAAGSGKTYILNRYIQWLRERGIEPAVTASTGIAATHIGGQTIHAWSGIGIKDELSPYDLDRIEQNEKLVKRFQRTHVLIIDEVSMLSANTLTMVNQSIQAGLQTYEPFGGMQVILCGDFFQLPPVTRGREEVQYAFQSKTWNELSLHTCYLTDQYRQNDTDLLALLNAIREGNVTRPLRALVEKRIGHTVPQDIPHLYTHNVNVDELNTKRLEALSTPSRIFLMKGKGSKKRVEILKKGLLVPEKLTLKVGAVVMFVKNHPQGLYVNGTLGTVTGFTQNPLVKTHSGETIETEPASWQIEDGEKVLAEVTQIPLRLAWAVTVHKSQGLTLDAAYIDLTKTFVGGQGYVALSRVKTFTGLYLEGINDWAYARHPAVAEANERFLAHSTRTQLRLQKTPVERIREVSKEFIFRVGGHDPDPTKPTKKLTVKENISTYEKTKRLLIEGASLDTIAKKREFTPETILSHIEKMLEKGSITKSHLEHVRDCSRLSDAKFASIARAFAKEKTWNLTPVRTTLKNKYSFDELRFARLFLRPWGKE